MDKKFKEVRNVLNMKNIIGAGIVMGLYSCKLLLLLQEQDEETTRYSYQDRLNSGSFNFKIKQIMTMQVYYNLKKLLKNNVFLLWTEQKSNSTGNLIAQTQDLIATST